MTNHVERWFQFWAITGFTDSLGKYLHGGELGGIRREETKIPETRKPREARLFERPSLPRGAPLLFHRVRRELLRGPINPALITSHFCWSLTRNRLGSRNGQSLSKSFSLSANNRQPVLRAPLPFGSFRLFDLLSLRSALFILADVSPCGDRSNASYTLDDVYLWSRGPEYGLASRSVSQP